MNKNLLDIWVTDTLGSDVAILTLDCYHRTAPNLSFLSSGTQITLQVGKTNRSIRLRLDDGDECSFPYLEVGPATAQELGLWDGGRYVPEFNGSNNTLTLTRQTVSQSQAVTLIDRRKGGELRITMGPALIAMLGMSGLNGPQINIRRDRTSCKARLITLPNEMSQELLLSPTLAAKLGLSPGEACFLQYSQTAKLLQFAGGAPMTIGDASAAAASVFRPLRPVAAPFFRRKRSAAKNPALKKAAGRSRANTRPKPVKVSLNSRSSAKKGSTPFLSRTLKK